MRCSGTGVELCQPRMHRRAVQCEGSQRARGRADPDVPELAQGVAGAPGRQGKYVGMQGAEVCHVVSAQVDSEQMIQE